MNNDKYSWYNNVLSQLTNAAEKFIGAFKKYGFVFSMFSILIFVIAYSVIIYPIRIDKIVEKHFITEKQKATEQNESAIERRLNADELIGNICVKVIDKFPQVQRILLLESHNSIRTLNQSTDLLFITCTMEMIAHNNNLEYVADNLQRQGRYNLIGGILNDLKYRNYSHYFIDDKSNNHNHRLFQKLNAVGDKEIIIFPFKDKNHTVLTLLTISGENLPIDEIADYIDDYRTQIENCL